MGIRLLIVHPDSPWILTRIADNLAPMIPETLSVSFSSMEKWHYFDRDAFFYIDSQSCWFPDFKEAYPEALHIGWFTHLHEDSPANFQDRYRQLDGICHQAQRYFDMFVEHKLYPAERMVRLPLFEVAEKFPLQKIRFGIAQRGKVEGKGYFFLQQVIKELDPAIRDYIELWFRGEGWETDWPCAVKYYGEDYEEYPKFYQEIDWLLIPSLWEGGPMSMPEALSCGIPVLAADVGWVTEFYPDLTFPSGDIQLLIGIIDYLVQQRLKRRQKILSYTWKGAGEKLLQFIEKLQKVGASSSLAKVSDIESGT